MVRGKSSREGFTPNIDESSEADRLLKEEARAQRLEEVHRELDDKKFKRFFGLLNYFGIKDEEDWLGLLNSRLQQEIVEGRGLACIVGNNNYLIYKIDRVGSVILCKSDLVGKGGELQIVGKKQFGSQHPRHSPRFIPQKYNLNADYFDFLEKLSPAREIKE